MTLPCFSCRRECASEFGGTYLLVLIGPSSVVVAPLLGFQFSLEATVFVAFVFGGTVASVILLLGKFSGAHINPAVSVANLLSGKIERRLFASYVIFQLAGGLLAGLSLKLAFSSLVSTASLGSTSLASGLSPVEGTLLEAIGTFILAISALSASSFLRTPVMQAALVGTTLFILILLVGPLTGASFNPSRSLGPSVFSGYFTNQIVYWVGPLLGGAGAGLVFDGVKIAPRSGGAEVEGVNKWRSHRRRERCPTEDLIPLRICSCA